MISSFWVFLTDSIILDLWILDSPLKFLTSWYLSFKNFHSGSVKHILYCLRNLKRLLYVSISKQQSSFLYVFSFNRCCIIMALLITKGLITIVSSFLHFESSFCSTLERLVLDFVSIFQDFKLFRISVWWSESLSCFEME